MLRHGRDMRLHHLEDEEVVLVDEPVIMQPTFEARMALPDQGRSDLMSLGRCQAERGELVDLPPREVLPIPTTWSVSAVVGRLITHSRLLRIIAKL